MCSRAYQAPATESVNVEDDRTINDHTAVMQNEIGSSAQNIAPTDDRMDRTYERRKLATALAGVFGLYFVFGKEYPHGMRNTCFFIRSCYGFFRTPPANCPDFVQQAPLLNVPHCSFTVVTSQCRYHFLASLMLLV